MDKNSQLFLVFIIYFKIIFYSLDQVMDLDRSGFKLKFSYLLVIWVP